MNILVSMFPATKAIVDKTKKTYGEAYGIKNPGVGIVLPGHAYLGPGNPLDNGPPRGEADAAAQAHDHRYSVARTRAEVNKADSVAIDDFKEAGGIAGRIGAIGLQTKQVAEKLFGGIYPSDKALADRVIAGMPKGYHLKKVYADFHGSNMSEEWLDRAYRHNPDLFEPDGPSAAKKPRLEGHKRGHSDTSDAKRPRLDEGRRPPPPPSSVDVAEADTTEAINLDSSPASSGSSGVDSQPGSSGVQGSAVQSTLVSSSSDITDSVPMDLPGTGKPQGDNGSPGGDEYYLPIKRTHFDTRTNVYSKTFQIASECFASRILGQQDIQPAPPVTAFPQGLFLTSELLEIPWHLPVMYMTPSEYSQLGPGAHVTSMSCKVTFRGCTVKFNTNASSTQVATLNTIQTLRAGVGLNKTGWGNNLFYTSFDPNDNMLPTGVNRSNYLAENGRTYSIVEELYGSGNRNGVPGSYNTGIFWIGRNYWTETGKLNVVNANIGWPTARVQKCDTWDAKTMVDKVIVDETYKPKIGPITSPLRYYRETLRPLDPGFNVPVGAGLSATRVTSVNQTTGRSTASENVVEPTNVFNQFTNVVNDMLLLPVEKSQQAKVGPWGQITPEIQPSINVGVQAMPQLNSINYIGGIYTNMVQASAYFDVQMEMHVSEHNPTHYNYFKEPNVPAGDEMYTIQDFTDQKIASTYAGLYTNTPPN